MHKPLQLQYLHSAMRVSKKCESLGLRFPSTTLEAAMIELVTRCCAGLAALLMQI